MSKDYGKLCPELSKHIPETTVETDLAPKTKVKELNPTMTKKKVEDAYELLKSDPQYHKVAKESGLSYKQVKELHKEMINYKNYSEEE